MMKSLWITGLVLALFMTSFPVTASELWTVRRLNNFPLQPENQLDFASIGRINKSDKTMDSELLWDFKTTAFGLAPFDPSGLLFFGFSEILAATQALLGLASINKATLEITTKKLTPLSQWLGVDGQQLLIDHLSSSSVEVIDKKGRIQKSCLVARDIVRNFLEIWLAKNSNPEIVIPSDNERESALADFLRQFGCAILSPDTIMALKSSQKSLDKEDITVEEEALSQLKSIGVLNKNFQIYWESKTELFSKMRQLFHPKFSSDQLRLKLDKKGLQDPKTQLYLLHDLGYLGHEDLTFFQSPHWAIHDSQFTDWGIEKALFYSTFSQKIVKLLNRHMTYEFHLQEALDQILLESLLTKEEMGSYKKQSKLSISSGQKEHYLHLLRLALLNKVQTKKKGETITFPQLDHFLTDLKGDIVKHLAGTGVQNKTMTILRAKNEMLVETGLVYIVGIGFATVGAIEVISKYSPIYLPYLNESMQMNLLTSLHYAHYIVPWATLIAGGVATVLSGKKLITHSIQLHNLHRGKNIIKKELEELERQLQSNQLSEQERNRIRVMKFFDLADKYLMKKKAKTLIGDIESDVLWTLIGVVISGLGTISALALFSLVTTSMAPMAGQVTHLFLLVSFALYLGLYIQEKHLMKDFVIASKAMDFYKQIFIMALLEKKELSESQKDFLNICFTSVNGMLELSKNSFALDRTRTQLIGPQYGDFAYLENQFEEIKTFQQKMRKEAKKVASDHKQKSKELHSEVAKLLTKKESYQVTDFDAFPLPIPKDFSPQPVNEVDQDLYIPHFTAQDDEDLMKLTSRLIDIYNTYSAVYMNYQKAYEQQERRMKYFGQPLTRLEVYEFTQHMKYTDIRDLRIVKDEGIHYLNRVTRRSSDSKINDWGHKLLTDRKGSEIKSVMSSQKELTALLHDYINGKIERLPPKEKKELKIDFPKLHFLFSKYTPADI